MKKLRIFTIILLSTFLAKANPKNFVVMIADDISACDLTTYGNTFSNTHNIDSLAKQGMVFDKAYLTASSCSPSRASILTSRYPHNNGEACELHRPLPLHLSILPKIMKDNGYFTIKSGKSHFGGEPNSTKLIKESFDIEDNGKKDNKTPTLGSGNWVEMLRKVPDGKPFFAWFASYDAHRPWDNVWTKEMGKKLKPSEIIVPPELVDDKATRADLCAYYNEVKRFDYAVGKVVKELEKQGKLQDTFIIVLADNGRAFPRAKTRTSNEIGGKAIMVVYCPSYSDYKGERTSSLVSTIDIAPTILDLANIQAPESFQGVSFSSILKDKNAETRDFVFAEQNWHDYTSHVRTIRYKDFSYTINARPQQALMGGTDIIKSDSYKSILKLLDSGEKMNPMQLDVVLEPRPTEEFYIISKDHHQVNNEIANPEYAEIIAKMKAKMAQWQSETGDSVPENYSKDKTDRRKVGFNNVKKYYGEVSGASNNAENINHKGPIKE